MHYNRGEGEEFAWDLLKGFWTDSSLMSFPALLQTSLVTVHWNLLRRAPSLGSDSSPRLLQSAGRSRKGTASEVPIYILVMVWDQSFNLSLGQPSKKIGATTAIDILTRN